MKILVVADDRLGCPTPITARAIFAGSLMGHVTVLTTGPASLEKAKEVCRFEGVREILQVSSPVPLRAETENLAWLIADLAKEFDAILAAATTFGGDLIPRASGLLGRTTITGVASIVDFCTFTRPIHAGNLIAKVTTKLAPIFLTIRPTAFPSAQITVIEAPIKALPIQTLAHPTHFSTFSPSRSPRPDPASAKTVVVGGHGLAQGGNFDLVEQLADRLSAAVGATRAAVDAGLASNDLQIGQTGRSIAPNLYIGMGLSGAIQHLAGIKDARTIVSINNDPEAPIHAVADYALVADLYEAVPELLRQLDKTSQNT